MPLSSPLCTLTNHCYVTTLHMSSSVTFQSPSHFNNRPIQHRYIWPHRTAHLSLCISPPTTSHHPLYLILHYVSSPNTYYTHCISPPTMSHHPQHLTIALSHLPIRLINQYILHALPLTIHIIPPPTIYHLELHINIYYISKPTTSHTHHISPPTTSHHSPHLIT